MKISKEDSENNAICNNIKYIKKNSGIILTKKIEDFYNATHITKEVNNTIK